MESLGLPLRQALQKMERLGVAGAQINSVGDLTPQMLSRTGRRQFRQLLGQHNLELTGLGCPLRHGLEVAEGQQGRIEHIRNILGLSVDLGPRLVLIDAGPIPEDAESPGARRLVEALLALGKHAEHTGAVLALRTGAIAGEALGRFLDQFPTAGLGVNLDPASLLTNGFDPYESAVALRGRVVYAIANDARRAARTGNASMPLGQGAMDWAKYLSVLEEIDHRGWLTIEQNASANSPSDITGGVSFLRQFLNAAA
jgi:sugar phosphate isomerase/epimerase